jgi:hypothetical protein
MLYGLLPFLDFLIYTMYATTKTKVTNKVDNITKGVSKTWLMPVENQK